MASPCPDGKLLLLHSTCIKQSQITLAALTKCHSTTWVSLIIHLQTLSSLAHGKTAGSWEIRSDQQNHIHTGGKDHTWCTGNHQNAPSVTREKKKHYKREDSSDFPVRNHQIFFFCIDLSEYTTKATKNSYFLVWETAKSCKELLQRHASWPFAKLNAMCFPLFLDSDL